MEETQDEINDYITFDQFKAVWWKYGIPQFMVDLLKYLTGQPDQIDAILSGAGEAIKSVTKVDAATWRLKQKRNVEASQAAAAMGELKEEDEECHSDYWVGKWLV